MPFKIPFVSTPVFWVEFVEENGRAPRADELSITQLDAAESFFEGRAAFFFGQVRAFEKDLQTRTRGRRLARLGFDHHLHDLVDSQLALQELRGEPVPDIYDLVKTP